MSAREPDDENYCRGCGFPQSFPCEQAQYNPRFARFYEEQS